MGMRRSKGVSTILVFFALTRFALSQTFQAQISGDVRASTGAAFPNAKLTATNVATNAAFSTQSNEQGIYRLPALPPGQYNVAASLTGFKKYEQGPITLQVNDNLTLDIPLQVGDAA